MVTTKGDRDWKKFTWIYVDALEAGDRVHTHNRVNSFDRLSPNMQTCCACAVRLGNGTVQGGQSLKIFLKSWTQ
jgi:hypothetical protein